MRADARTVLVLSLPLLVGLATATAGVPAGAAAGPSLTVTVDGTPVTAGGTVVVDDATPAVRVEAAVADDAPENATLSALAIRVDGVPHAVFDLENDTADVVSTPRLSYGRHTVEVVLADSTGDVRTLAVSVVMDDRPPFVGFESPFVNAPRALATDHVVAGSNVTFAGDVVELSRTDRLEISVRSRSYPSHSSVRFSHPGRTFTWSTFLAPGRNRVTVYAEDRLGRTSLETFTITVRDTEIPTGRLEVTAVSGDSATVRGVVADDVYVRSARLVVGGADYRILGSKPPGVGSIADRRRHEFSRTIPVPEEATAVLLVVEDTAGRVGTATAILRPPAAAPAPSDGDAERPPTAPAIDIDRSGVAFVDEDTIRVTGRVTGTGIAFVDVSSAAPDGDVVDYAVVTAGNGSENETAALRFTQRIGVRTDGPTEITVNARDSTRVATDGFWTTAAGTFRFDVPPNEVPTPTATPTASPTPTPAPTASPTPAPTATPTVTPTASPTPAPTATPTTASGQSGVGLAGAALAVVVLALAARRR